MLNYKIKEDLEEVYFSSNNIDECCRYFDICNYTLYYWINKHELPKKYHKTKNCSTELSDFQKELICGSMLGDGSLSKKYVNSNSLFSEKHSVKQINYLKWKSVILGEFFRKIYRDDTPGESLTKLNNNQNLKDKIYEAYRLETVRHPIFTNLELDWYLRDKDGNYILDKLGRRIKKVPKDLGLTELSTTIWFLDDGRNTAERHGAYISTDCFTEETCQHLSDLLNKTFNLSTKLFRNKNSYYEIYIGAECYLDFIDLIKRNIPNVPEMFYKVSLDKYNNRRIA